MTKSGIFLFFCLAFVFGVFAESLLNLPRPFWLGILCLGLALAAVFWGRRTGLVVAGFGLILLAGGAWRFLSFSAGAESVRQFNDKGRVILTGLIVEEPDARSDQVKYTVAVTEIESAGSGKGAGGGKILVVAKKYPLYQYGDKIKLSGKLVTPKSDAEFDYQKYLAKDAIFSLIYFPEISLLAPGQGSRLMGLLLAVKNEFKGSIDRLLVEPQGAFLAGLLLGEKRGVPTSLAEAFSRTGTTHIIALSGFNITIIAVALMGLFNFFMVRRQISFWVSVVLIILFVLMTGAAASVVRAAVMGILVLLARQTGRLYQIKNALVLAGAAMIYLNPKILIWDLGFQLSFAATLGLVYLLPILQNYLAPESDEEDAVYGRKNDNGAERAVKSAKSILAATLAAQLAVLPLLIINFGQLSLIAPLANLLILPAIPATMLVGFTAALAGWIFLPLGRIFSWAAWLLLTYEIKVVELLAKIPLAAVNFKWSWFAGGIYYAVLLGLICRFNQKRKLIF